MNKRIFTFGVDSASLDLILPWVKEDKLPNFKRLIDEGSWGALRSTFCAYSAPAWVTFMTGKNPGQHGVYEFFKLKDYSTKFISFSDIEDEPFWDLLADKGKKSYVINFPFTYPPQIKKGAIVSGVQTPQGAEDFIYPKDFWEEIKQASPNYRHTTPVDPRNDLKKYIEESKKTIEAQLDLVLDILRNKEWDLLAYVLYDIDTLQHFLWSYIDSSSSRYRYDQFLSNILFEFYQRIDSFLGEVFEALTGDTYLLILSDHGVGKLEKNFYINNWLLKNGYLFLKDTFKVKLRKLRSFYKMKDIDWQKTRAYSLCTNQVSINLKGREEQGIVNPGQEYETLRQELIKQMSEIKHPYKKKSLIDKIYKKEEIFSGQKLSELPDILFICDNFEIGAPGGEKVPTLKIFGSPGPWKGNHRLHGSFFAYGKGVKKGFEVKGAKIEDVSATITALSLGVVPDDFDGKVLDSIFEDEDLAKAEIEKLSTKKEKKGEFSQDQKVIKERLQALGYL